MGLKHGQPPWMMASTATESPWCATGTPTAKPRVKDAREAKEAKAKPEKLGRGILAACFAMLKHFRSSSNSSMFQ